MLIQTHIFPTHWSDKRLLYLAPWWQSHFYISAGHLILATNTRIVYWRRCIVCYFYAYSKWRDVNPRSRDTAVSLRRHYSNGVVVLVHTNGINTNSGYKRIPCLDWMQSRPTSKMCNKSAFLDRYLHFDCSKLSTTRDVFFFSH